MWAGGDGEATGGFLSFDDEQWAQIYGLNLFATVRTTRAALPSLLRRGGAVVNVSSNAARIPHAGPVPYTTAKAALTAFGKALAEEFGPQGVRVNTVSPGPVRTAMWESPDGYGAQLAASLGLAREQLVAGLPATMGMTTGRLVEPTEVAALIAYLASPLAASITGADHIIDGGAIKTA
ncbi:SDR family oxidoreductase [Nocardia sp. NPDC049707]|uniref:SDR family oxidoreductase n=1 Tax=Nocardia sp. NPDC049707 TaxID=3154735 RepID=UPI00343848D7